MVVLTDVALGDVAPSNDWQLAQSAKSGECVVLALRLDGAKLVNVRVNHKGITGTSVLPGHLKEAGANPEIEKMLRVAGTK